MTSECTFVSLFTGIGGLLDFTLHRLNWRSLGMVEKEPAAQAVLRARFPDAPLMGDINDVRAADFAARPTLIVLGFPCTDTSIAAPHRLGLAGLRSGLFFEGLRILDEWDERPEWVVIENPEGVLGSNGGRDWYTVLRALADRGYGFAYRVVDGRLLGRSPQQRRRVLLVAHRDGDPRPCLSVLGLPGGRGEADPADRVVPGRRSGTRPPIADSDAGRTESGHLIFRKSARARAALDKGGYETWVPAEHANTLTTFDGGGPARQTHLVVEPDGRVRALTVTEWERLSGFPDGWTEGVMPGRGGKLVPIPDAARQKMLGNCVHLGTGEWLGEQLDVTHKAIHGIEAGTVMTA